MKSPARLVPLVLLGLAALLMVERQAPAEPCPPLPLVLQLPPGFAPEGIASGRQHRLFVSSIKDGAIHALDARTGAGTGLVAPLNPARQALGMKVDPRTNHLFVARCRRGARPAPA